MADRKSGGLRIRLPKWRGAKGGRKRWLTYLLALSTIVGLAIFGATAYLYKSYARMIDERLHGERERSLPRVYARPMELRRGQSLSESDLIARLNDLGYAERAQPQQAGEFVQRTPGPDLAHNELVILLPRPPGRVTQHLEFPCTY